jgi:hypothetical protein
VLRECAHPMMNGFEFQTAGLKTDSEVVITGLDPVIYPLRKTYAKMDGCPDQVRA